MPQFTFRTELLPWSFLEGLDGGGRCLILGVAYPYIVREAVERLHPAEVVVVETSHEALETEAKAVQGAVRVKPVFTRVIERVVELPSNSFDLVIAVNSLERAMQKRGFMTEVRRLLKEGGRVLIVTRLRTFFRRSGLKGGEFEKLISMDGFQMVHKRVSWGRATALLIKTTISQQP
jgi:SAM-dependent methyltransferase